MHRRSSSALGSLLVACLAGCVGAVGRPAPGDPGGNPDHPSGGAGGGGSGGGDVKPPPGAPAERPGRTPMRRLTHAQYNNTIRDLLGLEGDFATSFGSDEDTAGYFTNGISPVSGLQLEQYQAAAADLAARAVAAGLGKLVSCSGATDACGESFVRGFGKRAFRRPLTPDEIARYQKVFAAGRGAANDLGGAVTLVLTAMLQSPNFLYLPEAGNPAATEKDGVPLTAYEAASRLSYFLISSMPDDELMAAADGNQLRTSEQLTAQARRLLQSPKARDSLIGFHRQWLEIDDMLTIEKDAQAYPGFTPAVRAAMHEEVAAFVDGVTRQGDGKLETLLGAGFSFPQAALGDVYGLTGALTGARVDLPAGQRAGLLTLPGVMAMYGHPDQSAPVGRGFLVSDKLLCNTPPPPPDNVDIKVAKPDPSVTTRERFEMHRTDPACKTCHGLMDPFGLTFEIYDGIGRYRTKDGVKAVDATSQDLPGIGDVRDAVDLMGKLARNADVRSCFTRQWFRYALGRAEVPADDGTLAAAQDAFARGEYRIPDLLVALAGTRGFRYRAPVAP
jgi:hypothetical protein